MTSLRPSTSPGRSASPAKAIWRGANLGHEATRVLGASERSHDAPPGRSLSRHPSSCQPSTITLSSPLQALQVPHEIDCSQIRISCHRRRSWRQSTARRLWHRPDRAGAADELVEQRTISASSSRHLGPMSLPPARAASKCMSWHHRFIGLGRCRQDGNILSCRTPDLCRPLIERRDAATLRPWNITHQHTLPLVNFCVTFENAL